MPHGYSSSDSSSPDHPLTRVIDRLAPLLPAQGPISIFIHHNTLHAFEHLPFEEAVERAGEERRAVHRLWNACVEAVGRAGESSATATAAPIRHRDCLQAVCGLDTDAWIHPPLIRFLAGYLDQGLAHWSMPERSRGIHGCFLEIYGTSLAAQCGPWALALPRLVVEERAAGRDALSSIANSLAQLGVAEAEW